MEIRTTYLSHKKIGLDTNLFIYAFEKNPKFGLQAKKILDDVSEGHVEAVTSIITLTEILTKPLQEGNEMLGKRYKLLFTHFPNLTIIPVDLNVAEKAAYLRGKYQLKTPDSLIVASSILTEATLFITNDHRLKQITELHTLSIAEF